MKRAEAAKGKVLQTASTRRACLLLLSVAALGIALCQCSDNPSEPENVNHAPVFNSILAQTIRADDTLSLAILAFDADGDSLALTCPNLPAQASFVDNGDGSGNFTFMPTNSEIAIHQVTFIADDGKLKDTLKVQITVTEAHNLAPIFAPVASQTVSQDSCLQLAIFASDPNRDTLRFVVESLPAYATWTFESDTSGMLHFCPAASQSGEYTATILVTDGKLNDTLVVAITVISLSNHAPVFTIVGPQTVVANETLFVQVEAVDPDSDDLTLSFLNPPDNSEFTDHGDGSGTFEFRPDISQIGINQFRIVASDGVLADTLTLTVTVDPVPDMAPIFVELEDQVVEVGHILDLNIEAYDPDGDAVDLRILNRPINGDFTNQGNGHGRFLFYPDSSQIRSFNVDFVATAGGLADTATLHVAVMIDTASFMEYGVFPCAVGNSWTYRYFEEAVLDTVTVSIVGVERVGGETWWLLSGPLGPLGDRFMVRGDSIFGEHGLELVKLNEGEYQFDAPESEYYDCGLVYGPRTATFVDQPTEGSIEKFGMTKHVRENRDEYWRGFSEHIYLDPTVGLAYFGASFDYQYEGVSCGFKLVDYSIRPAPNGN